MAETETDTETGRRPHGAARGVMLALLLSAPVWLGLGVWIWRLTLP